jgi:hypothetical protein
MDRREREILERLDERIERIDGWIAETGNAALIEIRTELEITRISYEHQLDLTRRVVQNCMRTIDRAVETMDRVSERSERDAERNREASERNREAFERNTAAFERFMAALDRHGFPGGEGPSPAAA